MIKSQNSKNLKYQNTEVLSVIRWEEIPPMSYARASPAVAASNGKIYAIGGSFYLRACAFTAILL